MYLNVVYTASSQTVCHFSCQTV